MGEVLLAYDEGIYVLDRYFKEMWEYLDNKNALKDSLIIFLADHGELLGEHDKIYHGNLRLEEEIIHIPMIIWDFTNNIKGENNDIVSIIDIFPTVLDKYGIKYNKGRWEYFGINLFSNDNRKHSGILAQIEKKGAKGEYKELGEIVYRNENRKIYVIKKDTNREYFQITNNIEKKSEFNEGFKSLDKEFNIILNKIKKEYRNSDNKTKNAIERSDYIYKKEILEGLKSLNYLH
jgi:arylsulfatase A-like enzyme